MNINKFEASPYRGQVKQLAKAAEALRKDQNDPIDVTFNEVIEQTYGNVEVEPISTVADLMESLGIDPSIDTISNIMTVDEMDASWIIPEIIREAIYLGLREAPIWPSLIAGEQTINQKRVTMPYINMSDAVPHKVGEGETIPLGAISYGEKSIDTFKIGRGIKLTYEIRQYVSLDVVSIFFRDFGIRLGQALDTLAIDVLINGDQANGSAASPVIGVTTANTKVYKDYLRPWVRGARMGRRYNVIIGGEDAALETLDLKEFKERHNGTPEAKLDMRTPIPNQATYFVHGNVPADQEILIDNRYALIKYNVVPLLLESDKIISNQTEEFYASMTLGFGKLFQDSVLLLDQSVSFEDQGFPEFMDVDAFNDVNLGS